MTERQYNIIRKLTESFSARMIGLPSLSEMASSLNTSKQALYRYFSSKEEIIDAMQEYSQIQTDSLNKKLAQYRELSFEEKISILLKEIENDPCFSMHLVITEEARGQVFDSLFPEYSLNAKHNYPLLTAALMTAGETRLVKEASALALQGIKLLEAENIEKQVQANVEEIFNSHPQSRFYKAIANLAFKSPLTTKALSDELGIAPSTIYSHYKDKKELVSKVLEEEKERYLEVQKAAKESEDVQYSLLFLLYTTQKFIKQGGRLSATLLLYAIRKEQAPDERTMLSPAELYTVISTVYLSENDTETIIGTLERGLIKTENI